MAPLTERDYQILLIENNDKIRSLLRSSLQKRYRFTESADGSKGFVKATDSLPDMIIASHSLPDIDGIDLCKKLKKDARTNHIPVVILTNKELIKNRLMAFQAGADDCFHLPFRIDEFSLRLHNLLVQRELLCTKYSNTVQLDFGKLHVSSLDDQFLKKLMLIIMENYHDFRFNVGTLQGKMHMSKSKLYKKIKALLGVSPVHLLRIVRLTMAAAMIQQNQKSITEVLMSVGFSNPSYFARCFKSCFGVTPKAYQRSFN